MSRLRLTFFVAAGLQVATIYLDHRLVPYCGTVAMAALLALAWSAPAPAGHPWTRPAAVAGLSLLTAAAALADHRAGGYGWAMEVAAGDGLATGSGAPGTAAAAIESLLVVAGGLAVVAAVLGRPGQPVRWWHLPGLLAAMALTLTSVQFPNETEPRQARYDQAAAEQQSRLRIDVRFSETAGLMVETVWAETRVLAPPHAIQRMTATESLAEVFRKVPPPEPAEARSRALERDARRESGLLAVPYPPSFVEGGTDWVRAWPAIKAALLALGLFMLVMALFPLSADRA
ncbi:hypothetical protein [Actinoplanes sp. NPDC026670]|uniref:hypothetical protein n=1 Tax=Actinoplanes sp. NPDC026670 TaxID=3154700 RepID=UPI0033D98886